MIAIYKTGRANLAGSRVPSHAPASELLVVNGSGSKFQNGWALAPVDFDAQLALSTNDAFIQNSPPYENGEDAARHA